MASNEATSQRGEITVFLKLFSAIGHGTILILWTLRQ
jgi:hypothetical protein